MRSPLALVLLVAGCGAASPSTPRTAASAAEEPSATAQTASSEPAHEPAVALAETSERTIERAPSESTHGEVAPESPPSEGARAEPLPAPLPREPVRAAIVVQGRDGAPRGESAGWDGEHQFVAVGLPAMSPDGRSIVLLEGGGDGANSARSLVTVSARTGALERRDALYESRASEEDTPEEETHLREARRQIARAQRYLARRTFLSLRGLDEASGTDEALTLETSAGVVEIFDSSRRSRFRREVVPPAPRPPPGLDEDAWVAWEVEHHCDDHLEEAAAWRIDATHVLLTLKIGATPDECWVRDEHELVTLSP